LIIASESCLAVHLTGAEGAIIAIGIRIGRLNDFYARLFHNLLPLKSVYPVIVYPGLDTVKKRMLHAIPTLQRRQARATIAAFTQLAGRAILQLIQPHLSNT